MLFSFPFFRCTLLCFGECLVGRFSRCSCEFFSLVILRAFFLLLFAFLVFTFGIFDAHYFGVLFFFVQPVWFAVVIIIMLQLVLAIYLPMFIPFFLLSGNIIFFELWIIIFALAYRARSILQLAFTLLFSRCFLPKMGLQLATPLCLPLNH